MLKKIQLFLAVAITFTCFTTSAFAAWNVPSNHRIVQKNNADNIRVFTTIQDALQSIPLSAPTATNPFLIKVMPGVYDLGGASLEMKPYVTLEGSGREATIITSVVNDASNSCSTATIKMADNSALKRLTVKNAVTNGGDYVQAIALNNVVATIDGISALVSGNAARNNGICAMGTGAHIILDNSYVETNATNAQSNPILAEQGSRLTMTNSKLLGIGSGVSVDVINCSWETTTPGKAVIMNSIIESSGNIPTYLVNGEACDLTITNSMLISDSAMSLCSINVSQNSEGVPFTVKVANSLIAGGVSSICGNTSSAKLANNHDENYNPIPNQ